MPSPYLEGLLGIQFFGEYLIDRWLISREQLLEALAYQLERNEKFGEVALRHGHLSPENVEEINAVQRTTDKTFGEVAVAQGFLNDAKVREIVTEQRNNNLHLGQILMRLGYLSEDALSVELDRFREHQERYSPEAVHIDTPEELSVAPLLRSSVDLTRKMFRRIVGVEMRIGPGVLLKADDPVAKSGYYATVSLPFEGDHVATYVLSATTEISIAISSSILREDASNESEALIVDGIQELCNIVCGNVGAQLAQKGVEVDICPPERLKEVPGPTDAFDVVAFPVRLIQGGVDLRFLVPKPGAQ